MEIVEIMEAIGLPPERYLFKAGSIRVGFQLAEADGFLWNVTEVIETTGTSVVP